MQFGKIDAYLLLGGGVLLSEFALQLGKKGYEVTVISSPRHIQETISGDGCTLGQYLKEHHVQRLVSEKISEDKNVRGKITDRTLGISFGAAWIFTKDFINPFKGRLLNLHGARLPTDRGAGGFSWQILRNNHLGCCLIHQVDPGIDTGPIVKYREFVYPIGCRIPKEYQQVYVEENKRFLSEFIEEVERGEEFRSQEQIEYLSTYWPRLSTDHHGYVDWSWRLREIEMFICAFDDPYQGASTFVNRKRVFLKGCFTEFGDGVFHPFQKGMVYRKSVHALSIATEDGTLVIRNVSDGKGADVMDAIRVGDRFYTPLDTLENARLFRAIYTPKGLK